ncbi:MAG: hypothetical protein ACHQPI_11880 [Thermoanaerobaculia bacterium]
MKVPMVSSRLPFAVGLSLLLALPAVGQNLLQNGAFDVNTSGWTPYEANIVASWSPLDADGSPTSGSILLTNTAPNGLNSGAYQCVNGVTPGTRLDAGAKIRIPSGGAHGQTFLLVWFNTGSNCSGLPVGDTALAGVTAFDAWTPVLMPDIVVPPGAASAQVMLKIIKNFPDVLNYQSHFDDLFLIGSVPATLTVPASASIHGKAGTLFATDLWVMNLSHTDMLSVSARHRCFAVQTCPTGTRTFQLAPRESRLYTDVLTSLFSDPETSGAIELTYDSAAGTLAATTRTYTPPLPAPTAGTTIPALPASEARTTALFLGLANNAGDLTSGFRSNAGAYNPNSSSVLVTFTLSGADGTTLGSVSYNFAPNEAFQFNDIFAKASAGSTVTLNAVLRVTSALPVFSYVTILDNQSGDQVYALPFTDPSP